MPEFIRLFLIWLLIILVFFFFLYVLDKIYRNFVYMQGVRLNRRRSVYVVNSTNTIVLSDVNPSIHNDINVDNTIAIIDDAVAIVNPNDEVKIGIKK